MDVLRWILIQCTTVRDGVAVLRKKLACAHYREHLIVKVCPFSSMFLYFVEIIKMDIDSMHNCYRWCGIEQGIGIRALQNISWWMYWDGYWFNAQLWQMMQRYCTGNWGVRIIMKRLIVKACPFSSMFLYFAERSRKHCMQMSVMDVLWWVYWVLVLRRCLGNVGCSIWFGWVLQFS